MRELWSLRVFMGTVEIVVYGDHDELSLALEKFENGKVTEVRVAGICNSADRAPKHVAVRADCVDAMVLLLETQYLDLPSPPPAAEGDG